AGDEATAHTEGEDAPREAQQVVCRRRCAPLDAVQQTGHIRGRDLARCHPAELWHEVSVEIAPWHGRMLEAARLNFGAIPVLAQRLERPLLSFLIQRRAPD